MYRMRTGFVRRRTTLLLQTPKRSTVLEFQGNDKKMPNQDTTYTIMALTEDQKKLLKKHYAELKKWNKKRKKDRTYWKQYYIVLKKIKRLIRYGV